METVAKPLPDIFKRTITLDGDQGILDILLDHYSPAKPPRAVQPKDLIDHPRDMKRSLDGTAMG